MKRQRPTISRKPLVLVIVVCLLLSGVLIPVGAHLPRLIEAEIVLGAWWIVWVCTLTWLLFNGHAVEDDSDVQVGGGKSDFFANLTSYGSDLGCSSIGDGCATIVLAVVAFILIGLALMLVVEFLVPAIALLLLASIGGMVARAVNDTHECQGRLGLSLLWGALWATVYIGPLALLVLGVSAMVTHRG